jgi:hypothetical protein
VRLRSATFNNHKKTFELRTSARQLSFPYAKADPRPTSADPIARVWVDRELGREGFSYVLASGREGTIHTDQVLEYNQDPAYMRDLLLYKLTVRAQDYMQASRLSKREVIRRLRTSPAQLYRMLDTTNYRKSVDQMLRLLYVLDCDVEFVVRDRSA